MCNELAFINNNPDAFLGYTAWAAGGFSATDYNLTMTPFGSAGNFTDQETVRQCVVGKRNGLNQTLATSPFLPAAMTPATPGTAAPGTAAPVTVSAGARALSGASVLGLVGFAASWLVV